MRFDVRQYIVLALRSIRSNLLRSILTLVIIGFGIMALVGILTAIDSIQSAVKGNFAELGANSFTIKNRGQLQRGGGFNGRSKDLHPPIDVDEAENFKQRLNFPADITIYHEPTNNATVKFESKKTNPNVKVVGIDENYLKVFGYNILSGRNLSTMEINGAANSVLLGPDVVSKIFEEGDSAVNQVVSIGSMRYRVAGILQSKGASLVSNDNLVLIPYANARRAFAGQNENYTITVSLVDPEDIEAAIDESTGLMRIVRKLRLRDENNFFITTSDRLANELLSQLGFIGLAASLIGIITLFGAGIGLMNIMLVSVNERTREIGVSKALGATKNAIIVQFLTEAIVICQIGGLLGIILGIAIGNVVSMLLDTNFIIPWNWMLLGIFFCFIVGISAGIYPALKAGKLNPVEALRYE